MTDLLRLVPASAALAALLAVQPTLAALPDGKQAKVCATCHAAPAAGTIRGAFDELAIQARSFQMKVDADVEVLFFDPSLKVVNGPEGENLEKVLKGIRKGAESSVAYTVEGGARKVSVLTLKPKLKVPEEKQVKTAQLEQLVAQGPEKGKYFLFDARPAPKYAEGYIPTAENLPFPAFEKEKGKLPADKGALVIFYCAGVTCAMSPAARDAAEKLGYSNAKSYHEGIPAWSKQNPMALSPKLLKEAWFDKQQPIVVLDARPSPTGELIPGAAAFPAPTPEALKKVAALKKLRPPVVVYDEGSGAAADLVARALVGAGQSAMVLTGGFAAWKAAALPVATGAPAEAIAFVPKPKPGELPVAQFEALVAAIPADTVVLDVRSADEAREGTFKGAINIPVTQLASRLAEVPKEKRIVTFCSTGIRAELAYNTLKSAGYPKLAFLATTVDFFGGKPTIGE